MARETERWGSAPAVLCEFADGQLPIRANTTLASDPGGQRMGIGVVAKIVSDKGFGFISPCGPGQDIFFHSSAVVDEGFEQLQEGQAVTFDLERAEGKGDRPRAVRVALCDPKLLGRTSADEPPPPRHARARRRKPTWRR
jgi:CspA family cold shock protein